MTIRVDNTNRLSPYTNFTGDMLVKSLIVLSKLKIDYDLVDTILEYVVASDIPILWTLEYQSANRMICAHHAWLDDTILRSWVINNNRPWSHLWGPHIGSVALRVDLDSRITSKDRYDPSLIGFRVVKLS